MTRDIQASLFFPSNFFRILFFLCNTLRLSTAFCFFSPKEAQLCLASHSRPDLVRSKGYSPTSKHNALCLFKTPHLCQASRWSSPSSLSPGHLQMIKAHMVYTSVQQFLLSALGYGLTAVSDLFPLEDHIPKLPPLCLQRKFPLLTGLGCFLFQSARKQQTMASPQRLVLFSLVSQIHWHCRQAGVSHSRHAPF